MMRLTGWLLVGREEPTSKPLRTGAVVRFQNGLKRLFWEDFNKRSHCSWAFITYYDSVHLAKLAQRTTVMTAGDLIAAFIFAVSGTRLVASRYNMKSVALAGDNTVRGM